ncbi:MAG: TetR family transcriptional regulator C-terminal domain-containing protein, partial [Burkholderiales bacterium]|nr:TetR family transcriptional regulator C-terminal domain-containing protein [Burkholderiales bacterium]
VCSVWNGKGADPLSEIRSRMTAVLQRTVADPQFRRVFHIVYHKCEYVDDMRPVWKRLGEMRSGCLQHVEQGFRDAIARGQLPRTLNPRRAAIGIYAMVDGLINNWVIDPSYEPPSGEAKKMVALYLDGLAAQPRAGARTAARGPKRKARRR